jgi:hypothetical protein
MGIWRKASTETGMQLWHKEQTPEIAATKQEGILQDLQENCWIGDHKVNCQIFCWVAYTQGLDLVEGSTPSEVEKEAAHGVRAGNVGALATLGSFTPTIGKKKDRKRLMFVHLEWSKPYQGASWDECT